MIFTHDTELSLASMAALVNTEGNHGDRVDQAGLETFLREWRWTGSRTRGPAELAAVRALRARLRPFWTSSEDDIVAAVNAFLREARALPQLVRHDGFEYHVHSTPAEAALADRLAVDFAMAMIDVVRQKELVRLRTCAAEGCGAVMVDLSKNRSRRFCDLTCANRTNVAAFRARRTSDRH